MQRGEKRPIDSGRVTIPRGRTAAPSWRGHRLGEPGVGGAAPSKLTLSAKDLKKLRISKALLMRCCTNHCIQILLWNTRACLQIILAR